MKKIIYQNIKEFSKQLEKDKANAVFLSKELNASRNAVSQYMNEYFTEGNFIKIITRPVIFFDKETIESTYNVTLEQIEFDSLESFLRALENEHNKDFELLIGYNDSLSSVVNTCKATISYPPNGLPLLLYGPTGTGKSRIAQTMYDYCVNQGLIDKSKQFLILNCSEYANNPELLSANLFGCKKGAYTGAYRDNPGLLKLAEGGILFLDEVHCLAPESQEKLFLFMDKGIYHMVGDNENWLKSNTRLIFATTEDPKKVLLKTLLRRIPMIVTVPSLQERGMREKIQLIYTIFKEESKRLKKKISLTNIVYNALITTEFSGNIGDLKNCIQASCVNANYKADPGQNHIIVDSFDLPNNLIHLDELANKQVMVNNQSTIIALEDLHKFVGNERSQIRLNNRILESFEKYNKQEIGFASFLDNSFRALDDYYDYIVLKKKNKQNSSFTYMQNILHHIFEIISNKYGFKITNNDLITITTYIHDHTRHTFELKNYEAQEKEHISLLKDVVQNKLYREYLIALEVAENINANVDLKLDDISLCVLSMYLKKFIGIKDLNKRVGIILAHGYSTASSIADAANRFLDQYIFDAIDMPIHVTNSMIVEQLNDYLRKLGSYEELILLVDMGSLEDIYKGIEVNKNVNVGIINNVTTKTALEIGNYICQGKPLEDILKTVCEDGIPTYHIIKERKKDPLILCSCASGLGTAEKLKKILQDSIPKDISIKLLTYDYNELIEKHLTSSIFDSYEVVCIVGTLNPNLPDVPFIPLEDLIINVTMDKLHLYFQEYLDIEQMKIFKSNILKNFSLNNLMNILTILNPKILLEHVADALDKMQSRLGITLSNSISVGLYVHISCLIERLVTHQVIDNYPEIEKFKEDDTEFIKVVKESFSVVENYYSVEISMEEIAYIHEYIKNN